MSVLKKKDFLSNLVIILFITVSYVITGYIGTAFAVPPGYATAIWIPSGIALGAVLVWGLRALVGVFLGSLITNYLITIHFTTIHLNSQILVTPIIITVGAMLQAWFGWYLIKKWVGINNILNHPNDILLFAFLSGPISCLVNTTWSNTGLYLLDILTFDTYFTNWVTWWMGDSIGVLIFTPLFLILFAQPKAIWRQRIFPILVPLCLSFILVTFSYLAVYRIELKSEFSWQIWSVLTSGLLFCIFINIVLFIVYGQKYLAKIDIDEKNSALRLSQSRNDLILNAAGEGIYGVDNNGLTTFVNPAAARMLGYTESELIGKLIHDIIHHSYPDGSIYLREECPVHAAYTYGRIYHATDEVYWRKDGTSFWVEYTSTPLMDNEKPSGAVVVFNDISKRHYFEAELEKMAHYDSLTSLPNRTSFLEQLTNMVAIAKREKHQIAVCFIDIDNFKQINDSLGHTIGDGTLKKIGKLLRNTLSKNDYLARLSGDEFGVIINDITSYDEIKVKLDQLIDALQKPVKVSHVEIHVSISIGVTIYPSGGENAEELIMNADITMYQSKYSGKGTYTFFDEAINKQIKRHNQIDLKMRNAIVNNKLSLNYQLLVDINNKNILGLETLLRWHDYELGEISPSEFVPIAEANGLIQLLGEWVLKQSFLDYKKIIALSCNKDLTLSVNVSVIQLENSNFLNTLKKTIAETQMECKNLLIEITETALMRNPKYTLSVMSQIIKLGIRFALDDFGISYSSMQYLKNLPVSLIKIDQIFVSDMLTNSNDAKIVNAIIQLSHGMNLHTLAEGVENYDQFQLLKKMGCEYMQGFYFSKPMSLSDLLEEPMLKAKTINI